MKPLFQHLRTLHEKSTPKDWWVQGTKAQVEFENQSITMGPALAKALIRAVETLDFYAKAPCSEKVLEAAPRFREPAKESLADIQKILNGGGE